MKEREDGHLNVAAPTANHQWNLAPVELAFPARVVLTSDIQIRIPDGLRPHGGADAAHMVAHARTAQCKALFKQHRMDAPACPLKLAHARGTTHTVLFKTLAYQSLDFIRHHRALTHRGVELGLRPYQGRECLHVAHAVSVKTDTLVLPHDLVDRMAADVQFLRDLALRLALDPVTMKDLVSFYHSFHFVGSGYSLANITTNPGLNFSYGGAFLG